MHRLALILLTGCTAMGVAQLRDAAAVSLDAEHVCTVADSGKGPAWYDGEDLCLHYDVAQAEAIVRRYGWGAVLGMLAHELGHAKEGNADERAADRWAGCALAKNGEGMRSTERFLEDYNPGPPAYETTDVRMRDTLSGFNRCTSDAH